jgi:DNA repair exonuclease SbcCD ATPase subunit
VTDTFVGVHNAFQKRQNAFQQRLGEAKQVRATLKATVAEKDALASRVQSLDEVAILLNSYADTRQAVVHTQIENIVTKGLQTIFAEPLSLRIKTTLVGKRTESDFYLVSGSGEDVLETPILEARGGGVAAVVGFLLQVILVLLSPNHRPTLFLDETFANLSQEYEEPLAEFIVELVEKSPVQVVLVTHSTTYRSFANKVYTVSQSKGVTKIVQAEEKV